MTINERFNALIKRENESFWGMIDGCDLQECVENAEYIYKFQSIYKYLSEQEPLQERDMEHLLKIENPIETICKMYNPFPEEYHEEILTCIETITNGEIFVGCCRKDTEKLFKVMSGELDKGNNDFVKKHAFEAMRKGAKGYDEYGVRTLLQFKEPLKLITDINDKNMNPQKLFLDAIAYVDSHDIYAMPYGLIHENITYESKCRHEAITKITDIIPNPDFTRTMNWINFLREVNSESADIQTENLYGIFIENLKIISNEYGDEIVQQVYDMEKDTMVLEQELFEVAKYLEDGGDPDRLAELVENDAFLKPYEDLKRELEEEQGGMQLC